MKLTTAIQAALIMLPLGAICLVGDAKADTFTRVHASVCQNASNVVPNQWGLQNENTGPFTTICPLISASTAGATSSINAVTVSFINQAVNSGNAFSCTVFLTNSVGGILESFTKSSTTVSSGAQGFNFSGIDNPGGPYPYGFMECTIPGAGTGGGFNSLGGYVVDSF
jgi:hypothetical protein